MSYTSAEIATELRRIADALDKAPEFGLDPYLSIQTASGTKEDFLALANIMPRPMIKGIDFLGTDYEDFKLEHGFWRIKIQRRAMCVLIKPALPAVYDCPTILSAEEESALSMF